MGKIACPACDGSLGFHLVGNLRIGVCDTCGGGWFGSGQLDSLVKHGSAALDELVGLEPAGAHDQHAQGQAKCPLCNTALQPTSYASAAPVHASACYQCGGVFLDEASIQALDAASKQRAGTGSFTHGGGFGSKPAMQTPAPPVQFTQAPPQITSISSGLFMNRPYYQEDSLMQAGATMVVADVAADVVMNVLDALF